MAGLGVVFFFPVLIHVVAMEMLLLFPVPEYLTPPIACKPFKWKSIAKSRVLLRGHVCRARRCAGLCSQSVCRRIYV